MDDFALKKLVPHLDDSIRVWLAFDQPSHVCVLTQQVLGLNEVDPQDPLRRQVTGSVWGGRRETQNEQSDHNCIIWSFTVPENQRLIHCMNAVNPHVFNPGPEDVRLVSCLVIFCRSLYIASINFPTVGLKTVQGNCEWSGLGTLVTLGMGKRSRAISDSATRGILMLLGRTIWLQMMSWMMPWDKPLKHNERGGQRDRKDTGGEGAKRYK